jgi:hypothetical protein
MKQAISYDLRKYYNITDIPRGPLSKTYLVDPVNGSDNNPGTNIEQPLLTLDTAAAMTVANQHDAVLVLSGAAALNPKSIITWKSYTHLVGLSSPVYGLGQRTRIVGLAATALEHVISFAGDGCIIKNIQVNNEKASGAASGCATMTGSRNYLENIFCMSPTAHDADSYALKMTGSSENVFYRSTIGQFTNPRAAASASLWMTGSVLRNKFVKSEFLCWSMINSHALVRIASDVTSEGFVTQFEDCLFDNLNGGASLTAAIVDGATETHHQILLTGQCLVMGCTAVANPLTYVFSHDQGTTPSGLLGVVIAEA